MKFLDNIFGWYVFNIEVSMMIICMKFLDLLLFQHSGLNGDHGEQNHVKDSMMIENSEQCCGIFWRNLGPLQRQAAMLSCPFSSYSYPPPPSLYQLLRFVCLFDFCLFEKTSSDEHRRCFN